MKIRYLSLVCGMGLLNNSESFLASYLSHSATETAGSNMEDYDSRLIDFTDSKFLNDISINMKTKRFSFVSESGNL